MSPTPDNTVRLAALPNLLKSFRDIRTLRMAFQLAFIAVVIFIGVVLVNNTRRGLDRIGLVPSFSFLNQTSNVQIDEGLTPSPHSAQDTFAHAFLLGIVNTMRVVVVGLVFTSILGLLVGIARLSSNWLVRNLAVVFIEIVQNTPLLIQLIFLYSVVFLALPPVRDAVTLPGPIFLSVRGLAHPGLVPTGSATAVYTILLIGGVIGSVMLFRRRNEEEQRTGERRYSAELATGLFFLIAVTGWIILQPYLISMPERLGPRYIETSGVIVSPEFTAIVVGLVLYTSAFVAEIVRSGIQAVPNGQWEAARAQGFTYFQTLRLIILPQALRVMVPPLTNQYLNLVKNSSLAGVVGFADVFGVGKTALDSGQTVPVVILVMGIYLVIDLTVAFLMDKVNQRVQLKTR